MGIRWNHSGQALAAAVAVITTAGGDAFAERCKGLDVRKVEVSGSNDEWTTSNISVDKGELVVVLPKGTVGLGGLAGTTGPKGTLGGNGTLEMKVGNAKYVKTGSNHLWQADAVGEIKFRVRDTDYTDNTGSFEATLLVMHTAMTADCVDTASTQVEGANDEWASTGLSAEYGDVLITYATGKVKLGKFSGSTGPGGQSNGSGALELKVGTSVFGRIGAQAVQVLSGDGELKLRVKDSKYDDNAGSFSVQLVRIRGNTVSALLSK